ncbi:MAG: STAS domain-containing protein [Planctomycetes bacterium]|nr:STAS domain-containing protein [Planctomycetota bacterium]
MRMETSKGNEGWVVAPEGPLAGEAVDAFLRKVEACVRTGDPRVALDCARVPYMDSRGLDALVSTCRELFARGGALEIRHVEGALALIFRATRMERHLDRLGPRATPDRLASPAALGAVA